MAAHEYDEMDPNEPPHKRRKTGDDSFVAVGEMEAEDDQEDEEGEMGQHGHHPDQMMMQEEDDLDGFIARESDVEEEEEEERRRNRRRHRKKKRRKHRQERISEDTLRMLAEQQGKVYKPDIDIDQGLSDGDSDDSDGGGGGRRLKKRVVDFDEGSVMGGGIESDGDDFHDYGDDQSVVGDHNSNHNHNRNQLSQHNRHDTGGYEEDFVVDDERPNGAVRYRSYYEDSQIDKLYGIFGRHIYDFLGIPQGDRAIEDNESDQDKDQEVLDREAERKDKEARENEERLKNIQQGTADMDPKQRQRVLDIIEADIPERLQERIRKTDSAQMEEQQLNAEANWILEQPYFISAHNEHRVISTETVMLFLRYFRIRHLDVPYITTYLRDEYPNDVTATDVWKLDELDEKYQQIYLWRKNIENGILAQVEKKLRNKLNPQSNGNTNGDGSSAMSPSPDLSEHQRWMDRVKEAKELLNDARTHEALEAVEKFLNIIPTADEEDHQENGLNGSLSSKPSGPQFPQSPRDLLSADAMELVKRFNPQKTDRAQLEDLVKGQIEDKLHHNPAEQEINEKKLDIDELTMIRDFYRDCMNDVDNAADKVLDYDFQGEEAFQFLGGSKTDLVELDENIRGITTKLAQMAEEQKRLEDDWEIQRVDYEAVKAYYDQCLAIMPKVKRTKKAASMLRSGKNAPRGRGAFKLSVPKAILPLCHNIGFSNIVSDNVKEYGQSDHGGLSCDNVQTEQNELREICEEIVSQHPHKYSTTDEVVTDCVYHLARHIGHEPRVKKWVRTQLEHHGVISTQPTQRGRDLIEWTDELACVKRLENKPISKFLNSSSSSSTSNGSLNVGITADGLGPDDQLGPDGTGSPKLHWLLIHKGTKQQLLKNHVHITEDTLRDTKSAYHDVDYVETYFAMEQPTIKFLLYKLAPMYIASSSKAEFKELKLRILKDALNLYLVPTAFKWLKRKMLEHDEESVISDAASELKLLANVAGERASLRGKTLLSIIVGEESSPSFLVLLNHFGDVIDETMLHYMKTHIRLNPNSNTMISTHDRLQLEKKNGDLKLLREFVEQHKPSLIVIDAGNLLARNFKADIEKALASNDYSDGTTVRVEFVDPCVSLLYRNSDDAIKEFQSWSVCQRQAVSLGRFVLDPITELSKRWAIDSKTGKNEMLSLPLHPNMSDVDPMILLKAFRKVLMDVTNQVGVLLNLSSQRDFLSGPVQFISGLGPRKAKNLLFQLKQRGSFPNRKMLEDVLHPVVYKNAVGFIRINRSLDRPSSLKSNGDHDRHHHHRGHHEHEDEEEELADDEDDDEHKANLLDDTRIHPDDYHWAVVVIISAMDIDEESAYSNDTLTQLRKPENLNKLEILNLDIFAERIRKRKGTRIVAKLYLIKQEVREGFKEQRPRFESPGETTLYHLLCGQTRASLREGMLVNVAIRSITSSGIKCKLPWCGLDAWLPAQNLSAEIRGKFDDLRNQYNGDIHDEQCREERKELILIHIKQQTHLEARVILIDKAKFSVKLSCLADDIKNTEGNHEKPLNFDTYLNRHHEDDDSKKAVIRARKEAIKNRPLHRNIKYPFFFNITRQEAEKKLAAADGGMEVLFRPSSRGLSHLSMTWKMADNPDIIVHYVIEERMKPNPYAIGKQLVIVPGKEIYEDLDEIYHHHIPKLRELVGYMIAHKNFRYGTEMDIAEMLKDDMNTNNKTCYALSYSYERPGHFLLSYMVPKRAKVSKEYIGLHYRGYKFRTFFFDDPTKLMNWFKTHFRVNHPKYQRREQQLKKQRREEMMDRGGGAVMAGNGGMNGNSAYMHPSRQSNLDNMHNPRGAPIAVGGGGGGGPIGGGSLNDDVMFNNNGFHHPPHHHNGGHHPHHPPPPGHYGGGGGHRPHGGGYQNGYGGGHHSGYGHNGHSQYGAHNGHSQHHGGGHRRQRSSSRSRDRNHRPYNQHHQNGRY